MQETPDESPSAPPSSAEGVAFELSAADAKAPGPRARYAYPLVHYEGIFATKARAMKRWIAIGRDADPPELPPLDEPWKVAAWWRRRMTNRPPDKLLELQRIGPPKSAPVVEDMLPSSVGATVSLPQGQQTAGVAAPIVSPKAEGGGASVATVGARGFAGMLQRLREAEAQTGELHNSLLRRAAEENDAGEQTRIAAAAEQTRRAWEALTTELRHCEAEAPKVLAAAGDSWYRPDVLAVNLELHTVIAAGVRGLVRRIRPKLASLTPAEQDAKWEEEVDRLFSILRANKFTAPPADDAAA